MDHERLLIKQFKRFHKSKKEEQAMRFVGNKEVELRRVAQISRKEFAKRTRMRFCPGGMVRARALKSKPCRITSLISFIYICTVVRTASPLGACVQMRDKHTGTNRPPLMLC